MVCLLLPLVLLFATQNFLLMEMYVQVAIVGCFILSANFAQIKYGSRYFLLQFCALLIVLKSIMDIPGNSLIALSFFSLLPVCENLGYIFSKVKRNFVKAAKLLYWLVVGFTIFLYIFLPVYVEEIRFSGFSPSPTTFTTYLLYVFTIYLFTEKSTLKLIVALAPTVFFVAVSQTRISFLLLGLILALKVFNKIVEKRIGLFFVVTVIVAISFYPLVTILGDSVHFTNRYEGQQDYSTLTRLNLFSNQVNALLDGDFSQYLIGNGIGTGDMVGFANEAEGKDQHNDFFTLVYEYGIPFFLIFLLFMYRFANSVFALAIIAIYFFSFYHNMLYNLYAFLIISMAYYYSLNLEEGRSKASISKTAENC